MADIPFEIAHNVRDYGGSLAIMAPKKGRLLPLLISGFVFISLLSVHLTFVYGMLWRAKQYDLTGVVLIGVAAVGFGVMFFYYLRSLLSINEVLLLPDQQKIVLRRERSKRVVSEHSIDDIEVRTQDVQHEDMSRTPMTWFTLFDTNRRKQIFAIRPTGQGGEAMAVGDLEEFFNDVMRGGGKK